MSMSERELEEIEKRGGALEALAEFSAKMALLLRDQGVPDDPFWRQWLELVDNIKLNEEPNILNALSEVRRSQGEAAELKEREKHFAKVLGIADGGQYRHDWNGKLAKLLEESFGAAGLRKELAAVRYAHGRLVIENTELRERVGELEGASRRQRTALVEAAAQLQRYQVAEERENDTRAMRLVKDALSQANAQAKLETRSEEERQDEK